MNRGMKVSELREELERLELYGLGDRVVFDYGNPDYIITSIDLVDIDDEHNPYDCDDNFTEVVTVNFAMAGEYNNTEEE